MRTEDCGLVESLGGTLRLGRTEVTRLLRLEDVAPFPDGSGLAVRFHEHPSRHVLDRANPSFPSLERLLPELQGKSAVFVLDWQKQRIVGILQVKS
jgi:hypothetical protein